MDPAGKIARRARQIEASGIRKLFDLAARTRDAVDLSIGQPDFDVPEAVKEAAIAGARAGLNRYTPSGGIPELRAAVAERFRERNGVSAEDVLITAGGSGALTLALLALVDPGEEVLVPDPFFVSYKHLTTLCGGTPVFYDTYPDFRIRVEGLEKLITPRTKALITMSPANPTGACLDEETRRQTAELARRRGLMVISDEIYNLFTYGAPARSLAAFYPEGTIVVDGLSKTAAMTGWRLGWAVGPKAVVAEMTKLQQFTFVCAPSFAQQAALAAFHSDLSGAVPAYRRKRDLMVGGLREAGYEVTTPGGAFYLFPRVPVRFPGGQEFAEAAAERKLFFAPGRVFSNRDTHFRLSYAASDEKLARALEILRALAMG